MWLSEELIWAVGWKKNEEKWTESKDREVGWHQLSQHVHNRSLRRRGGIKRERIFEKSVWKLHKFEEDSHLHIQKLKYDKRKEICTYTHCNQMVKNWKQRIFKVGRRKWLIISHIQMNLNSINSWFSFRNLWSSGGQRQWDDIFRVLKEKDCQPSIPLWGRTLLKKMKISRHF